MSISALTRHPLVDPKTGLITPEWAEVLEGMAGGTTTQIIQGPTPSTPGPASAPSVAPDPAQIEIGGGEVKLDSDGLYLSPEASTGTPGFQNANGVRWTTDPNYRTAIWRSDALTGSAVKEWFLEHISNPVDTVISAVRQMARIHNIGSLANFVEAVTHLTGGAGVGEWRAWARNEETSAGSYPLLSLRGGTTPVDQRVTLGIGAHAPTYPSAPTITAGFTVYPSVTQHKGRVDNDSGYRERSRTVDMGAWTAVPYSGANFTASSGTWTVDAGDVTTLAYTLVGSTMTVAFEIAASEVSAAAGQLRIAIPGGHIAARSMRNAIQVVDDGVHLIGIARVFAAGAFIELYRDAVGPWTITAGPNTSVLGQVTFEVQL
jgi:hypothetical protein